MIHLLFVFRITLSNLIPQMIPASWSTLGRGVPSLAFWSTVSSNKMTPPKYLLSSSNEWTLSTIAHSSDARLYWHWKRAIHDKRDDSLRYSPAQWMPTFYLQFPWTRLLPIFPCHWPQYSQQSWPTRYGAANSTNDQ